MHTNDSVHSLADALRMAVYIRTQQQARWVDAVSDAASFYGLSVHTLGNALRAAGHPVPLTL